MMDLFGVGHYAKASDFESFRVSVAAEMDTLRHAIDQKVTDSEQIARTAAANAVESENRVKELESQFRKALAELHQFGTAAKTELDSITAENEKARTANNELNSAIEKNKELFDSVFADKSEVDSAKASVNSNIEVINEALAKSEMLPGSVERVEKILNNSEELFAKISDLLSHSAAKKGEIDELRDKILGKEMEVDGSNIHVDGIKDKLERSYTDVDARIKHLNAEVQTLVDAIKSSNDVRLAKYTEDFEALVSESGLRIQAIDAELKNLLPGAMAAGLSAAYAKKKDDETESIGKSETKFQNAIFAMAAISAIPLAVDTYLLFGEKFGIIRVIQDTPNLLLAILPLYLPALWIALSLNKKINLSKRLIEEYTHKEVLGKTFSGISNQIETLTADSSTKEELRTRLLFNLLHVSAENPGKLITDYNKSDHPLLSVLDNSKKLADSMEALSKIPGLAAITRGLAARAEKKVEEAAKDVAKGVDLGRVLDGNREGTLGPEPTN